MGSDPQARRYGDQAVITLAGGRQQQFWNGSQIQSLYWLMTVSSAVAAGVVVEELQTIEQLERIEQEWCALWDGCPIKMSDIINLSLKLTGTISSPSLSVNLKDVAGDVLADIKNQAEDFAKAKADSLKQKAKDSLNVIKSKAEQKAKEALAEKGIDTANLNIKNAKDTIVKRVTDTLKKKAKDSLKSKIKKLFN